MPSRCVCYTTDAGYLFPSFVSASQARIQSDPATVDIVLLAFDLDAAALAAFEPACRTAGVQLLSCRRDQIHGAPPLLARLFLDELLPPQYRTFLYLDGDTTVGGSLMPLLDAELPAGRFLAANDPMSFSVSGRNGRQIRSHFDSIGLPPGHAERYFNSGVILADREGWARVGAAAWAAYAARGHSDFPDQDVLNVAGAAARLPMSLRWNFPVYLFNARVARTVKPHVVHYMSRPKPWQGSFPPWNRAAYRSYLDVVRRFPALAPYRGGMGTRQRLRYHLQQRYKRLIETVSWGFGDRRRRILDYERELASDAAVAGRARAPGVDPSLPLDRGPAVPS